MSMEIFLHIYAPIIFLSTALVAVPMYLVSRKKMAHAQELLAQSKQEAREIAELALNNPHPLIQLTTTGKIVFANPAAFECFPGIKDMGLSHPVLSNIEKQQEKTVTRDIDLDGTTYSQTITLTEIDGEKTMIVYCYDISERKAYERDLKATHEEAQNAKQVAEKANEARGSFLASMSHELRTPMNGIIGLSDLLLGVSLKDEHKEMLHALNHSARSLLILLNDLLDFSKIEAGELSVESIPFDLHGTIQQTARLQTAVAEQKGLGFQCHIDDETAEWVVGDPGRLQQVLNNLLSNAMKFTEKGSVSLRVSETARNADTAHIAIEVTDTGIGIPTDKQDSIFAKFQQADTSTARKYGGTGLGLYITRDLVQLMGGKISLESTPGKGTKFTITLPLKVTQTQQPAKLNQTDEIIALDTEAPLLIVDDHPVNLLFMRKTLKKLGMNNFDEASSGQQALDMVKQKRYELIFMDCQMPDMDGYETTGHIRNAEHHNDAVIIAVTADVMHGTKEKCLRHGMQDYISKPVDQIEIIDILDKWLPSSQKRDNQKDHFNWDKFNEHTDGDPEAEAELLALFLHHMEQDIQSLQSAHNHHDDETWRDIVHRMCGACFNLGAHALAEICDKAQDTEDTDDIKKMHVCILAEYKDLSQHLSQKI